MHITNLTKIALVNFQLPPHISIPLIISFPTVCCPWKAITFLWGLSLLCKFIALFAFNFIEEQLIMLCQFLLCSRMTQLHPPSTYISPFFFIFFSITVCSKTLNIVPCAILYHLSYIQQFASDNPEPSVFPPQPTYFLATLEAISLEKEMAIHSSILAWRIPWTEKPSRLQSTGSQIVRHD